MYIHVCTVRAGASAAVSAVRFRPRGPAVICECELDRGRSCSSSSLLLLHYTPHYLYAVFPRCHARTERERGR